jgi:hypothetical protein
MWYIYIYTYVWLCVWIFCNLFMLFLPSQRFGSWKAWDSGAVEPDLLADHLWKIMSRVSQVKRGRSAACWAKDSLFEDIRSINNLNGIHSLEWELFLSRIIYPTCLCLSPLISQKWSVPLLNFRRVKGYQTRWVAGHTSSSPGCTSGH